MKLVHPNGESPSAWSAQMGGRGASAWVNLAGARLDSRSVVWQCSCRGRANLVTARCMSASFGPPWSVDLVDESWRPHIRYQRWQTAANRHRTRPAAASRTQVRDALPCARQACDGWPQRRPQARIMSSQANHMRGRVQCAMKETRCSPTGRATMDRRRQSVGGRRASVRQDICRLPPGYI